MAFIPEQSRINNFAPQVRDRYSTFVFARGASDFSLCCPQFVPDLVFHDTDVGGGSWDPAETGDLILPTSIVIQHSADGEPYPGAKNKVFDVAATITGGTDRRGFQIMRGFTMPTASFSFDDWRRFGYVFTANDNITYSGTQTFVYNLNNTFGIHQTHIINAGSAGPAGTQLALPSLPIHVVPNLELDGGLLGTLADADKTFSLCSTMTLYHYEISKACKEQWFLSPPSEALVALPTQGSITAAFSRKATGLITRVAGGDPYMGTIHLPSTIVDTGMEFSQ